MLTEYFPVLIFMVIAFGLGVVLMVTGGVLGWLLGRFHRASAAAVLHVDLPVEASALIELNATAAQLSLDVTGGLQLESAVCGDVAGDSTADHGVLGVDVTDDLAAPSDDDRLAGANGALDTTFDADGSVGLAVAAQQLPL